MSKILYSETLDHIPYNPKSRRNAFGNILGHLRSENFMSDAGPPNSFGTFLFYDDEMTYVSPGDASESARYYLDRVDPKTGFTPGLASWVIKILEPAAATLSIQVDELYINFVDKYQLQSSIVSLARQREILKEMYAIPLLTPLEVSSISNFGIF